MLITEQNKVEYFDQKLPFLKNVLYTFLSIKLGIPLLVVFCQKKANAVFANSAFNLELCYIK